MLEMLRILGTTGAHDKVLKSAYVDLDTQFRCYVALLIVFKEQRTWEMRPQQTQCKEQAGKCYISSDKLPHPRSLGIIVNRLFFRLYLMKNATTKQRFLLHLLN